MEEMSPTILYEEAKGAVLALDAGLAHKILLRAKRENLPIEDALRRDLLMVSFSIAGEAFAREALVEQTAFFLEDQNRLFLDPVSQVESRLQAAGYGFYNSEQNFIKDCLGKSAYSIGNVSLREWMIRFEEFFKKDVPSDNFFLEDQKVAELQKSEQKVLKNLFTIYEQWLRDEVLSVFDLAVLVEAAQPQEANRNQGQGGTGQVLRAPILKALSEYPNLGNQNISQERIRIKSQPEPVRGSLYNWIKYYRDELGIGQHSTVERGQFLFRSENGKALNALERERVNLILKSLEENLPLEIDTERQEIIFPPVAVETSSSLPVSVAPAPLPSREPVVERVAPVAAAPLPPVVEPPKPQAPVRLDAQPFVPKPVPSRPVEPVSMASKFQPSASPYQKISIPPQPLSPERLASSNSGIDVSQMAEKLKREPKPEWIKGVFTKESIPETTPIAPAVGTMSFSFNHALPAEQEKRQTPLPVVEPSPEPRELQPQPQVQPAAAPQVQVVEKNVPPAPARGSSQFHIRPVSRRDS